MIRYTLLCTLAACATDPTPPELRTPVRLYWNAPIDCGQVISRPCPWLAFTTMLVDPTADTATSTPLADATALDTDGFPADHRPALVEAVVANPDGTVELPERADDGGLRLAATLDPALGGDVSYILNLAPAGPMTFHLAPRCAAPCVLTTDGTICISPETGVVCQ